MQINFFRHLTGLFFLVASLALVGGVGAQTEDLYRWTSPAASEQLAGDTTALPSGKGAIFVPSMTSGADEPEVLVFSGDRRVASGKTGQRIVVDPGSYTIRVGSGTVQQMVSQIVRVAAGSTRTVESTWAGLRIEVVDENNIPHRGTYELIGSDREVIGIGYGADTLQGEALTTWLLPPGLYRIVRPGETYRARRDFATVTLREGGLVHFKLVTEPSSGNFRGGGIVSAEEVGIAVEGNKWTRRVTLGGAASLNSTSDVVGATNQTALQAQAFFDAYLTYEDGPHFASGIFELEEGLLQVDPDVGAKQPSQKTQDRLRADVLYTRYINDWFGPYARFGLLTNVFASDSLATEDTAIAYNRLDGTRTVVLVPANSEYRTADGFGSLRIREGIGANFRLLRNRWATVNWRAGVGLRQNLFNNTFDQRDLFGTPEIDFFEVDDFNQEGVETTLIASVRLGRNLLYITDLEVFGDFGELSDPTIDWRNTLSLRLTRAISLDYTLDYLDIPQISSETQLRQNLLLRFSFDLF